MTKSSCIQHPKRERLIILRQWQVEFCKGDHCAAALLSFIEYWHNIKLEIRDKNKKTNNIAEQHGDTRMQDESLLQFHTVEELEEGILNLYSKSAISKALKFLEEKSVITVTHNPNPKYSFDKTRYIEFKPEICQRWLDENEPFPTPETQSHSSSFDRTPKIDSRSAESSASMTENSYRSTNFSPSIAENSQRSTENGLPSAENRPTITKITTKITNKEIKAAASQHTSMPTGNAAAFISFAINAADTVIGKDLTSNQLKVVQQVVDQVNQFYQIDVPEQLVESIKQSLLNPNSFSQAGIDFSKKLNTIKKAIREGKFLDNLIKRKQESESRYMKIMQSVAKQIRQFESDLLSLNQALQTPMAQDEHYRNSIEGEIILKSQKLKDLQQNLRNLQLKEKEFMQTNSFYKETHYEHL